MVFPMDSYPNEAEAHAVVGAIFNNAASRAFMVPVSAHRFLATAGPRDDVVVALGGGGIYGVVSDGVESFRPVAEVAGAFVMTKEVALGLAAALTAAAAGADETADDGE